MSAGVDEGGEPPEPTTREAILRQSSKLFAERGYHGTSTREIAAAVGIRQPSLFHHFPAKADIMAALHELDFEPSLETFRLVSSWSATTAAKLYAAIHLEVRRYLVSDYDFTGTTAAAVLNDPTFASARVVYGRVQAAQTGLIAEGVESGELMTIDPRFANRAVDWTIEGVLVDAARNPDVDPDQMARLLASFTVRSLLADTDRLDEVRAEAGALMAANVDPSTV